VVQCLETALSRSGVFVVHVNESNEAFNAVYDYDNY